MERDGIPLTVLKHFPRLFFFLGFLLAGCQSHSAQGHLNPTDPASLFAKPIKTIAVLPVQNASHDFLILYSGRASVVERTVGSLLDHKKGKASYQGGANVANPQYVPGLLTQKAASTVVRKNFKVSDPRFVEREYFRVANRSKDVTPFELSLSIPADAFLFITVTSWDSQYFSTDGKIEASFALALIRAGDGETLWNKKVPRQTFGLDAPMNGDLTYPKRQEELVEKITAQVMRDFPPESLLNAKIAK